MRIYANDDPKTVYLYLYYGSTEVDYHYGDPEYDAACEECDAAHHQLDIAEDLLKSAGYDFWYDGWGALIVTEEAFDNVLAPAIERGELDEPIDVDEKDYNNSWLA